MDNDVSIIIGTYGDINVWGPLAERAMESARNQTVPALEVLWCHKFTLQAARNAGAEVATGEWLVHLDADDTLDPGYVEGILSGWGDLRQPKTIGVYADGHEDAEAVFIAPKTQFDQGNWCVIGSAIRKGFFDAAGGWGDEGAYEDWSLWWRCWLQGAEVGQAPGAIYRVSVHDGPTRNTPDRATQVHWFNTISSRLKHRERVSW